MSKFQGGMIVLTGLLISVPQMVLAWGFPAMDSVTDATVVHDYGLATSSATSILTNIIGYLLLIISFLGILIFIVAGILYLLSAGDEKKAKTAKDWIVNALIGIAIALVGFVIMYAVSSLVGASSGGL
jgi:hypothetical protein